MINYYSLTVAELFESYYECRKRKRNKPSSLLFEQNLESNLMQLYRELQSGYWQPSPATVFAVTHPKPREVWAADFRDRIVHHLVYRAIGPAFEKTFIHDTCACIKGRGTLYAAKRIKRHLLSASQNWTKPVYVLKMDIGNFFGSILQDALFDLLLRKVQNEFLLDLLHKLVFQDVKLNAIRNGNEALFLRVPSHKSLFNAQPGVGLPIGNLSSQFFANVYLDPVDQHIKRVCGMKHYVRYVDDMIVIHESPVVLQRVLESIKYQLGVLSLALAPHKISIEPAHKGVDFVGHVIRPYRHQWRPKTYRCAVRKIAESPAHKAVQTCNSYLGLARSAGNHTQTLFIAKSALRRGLAIDSSLTRSFKTCLLNSRTLTPRPAVL